ncbi:MAG: hypothetical protein ACRCT8_14005 [Lacipirellulaceae bacterium]
MAQSYAGVLGCLGMAVAMARGALAGAGFEGTATTAVTALVTFAAVGGLVGWIAEATIDESVRQRLEAELAEIDTPKA